MGKQSVTDLGNSGYIKALELEVEAGPYNTYVPHPMDWVRDLASGPWPVALYVQPVKQSSKQNLISASNLNTLATRGIYVVCRLQS